MNTILAIVLVVGIGIVWARAAHIGYPFRGPGYDSDSGVATELGGPVIVAVTDGAIRAGEGAAFLRELKQVLDGISANDGLIGYAARKQLIGNRVWTLSAWTSRDALKRFVRSDSHRQAVKAGGISPASVHSVTLEMSPEELPVSWGRVREILEKDTGF